MTYEFHGKADISRIIRENPKADAIILADKEGTIGLFKTTKEEVIKYENQTGEDTGIVSFFRAGYCGNTSSELPHGWMAAWGPNTGRQPGEMRRFAKHLQKLRKLEKLPKITVEVFEAL